MPVDYIIDPETDSFFYRKRELILDNEYVNKVYSGAKEFKNGRLENKGWSKERKFKWHGSVPHDIWFDKIKLSGDPDYWKRDNWKNYRKFLNDNPIFRAEDHIV